MKKVLMVLVVFFITGCATSGVVQTRLLNNDVFESATNRPTYDASTHITTVYDGEKVDDLGRPIVKGRSDPVVTMTVPGETTKAAIPAAVSGAFFAGGVIGGQAVGAAGAKAAAKVIGNANRDIAGKQAEVAKEAIEAQKNAKPQTVFNLMPQAIAGSSSESANYNQSQTGVDVNAGGCVWDNCSDVITR